MILFVRTKNDTEEVAEKLRERGFDAAAINGDIPQNQRERTVDQLKDGRLDILVATDVQASNALLAHFVQLRIAGRGDLELGHDLLVP